MTKFRGFNYASPCSLFLLLTLFWSLWISPFHCCRKQTLVYLEFGMDAQCSLPASPRLHRWRSCHQQWLRVWAHQQTESTQPGVDGCQETAASGCEKQLGSDSRPANKLVAIDIPFHDSAVPYERVYCVRSRRLQDPKEGTAEGSCWN